MTGAPGKMGANNQMKLEMAKRLAAKINFSKNLGQEAQDITQQATKAIFQDGVSAPQVAVCAYLFILLDILYHFKLFSLGFLNIKIVLYNISVLCFFLI